MAFYIFDPFYFVFFFPSLQAWQTPPLAPASRALSLRLRARHLHTSEATDADLSARLLPRKALAGGYKSG